MTPKPNTEANPAKTSSEKLHVSGGFYRIWSLYFALYFPSDLKFSFPGRDDTSDDTTSDDTSDTSSDDASSDTNTLTPQDDHKHYYSGGRCRSDHGDVAAAPIVCPFGCERDSSIHAFHSTWATE
jgi:hypothetical protein